MNAAGMTVTTKEDKPSGGMSSFCTQARMGKVIARAACRLCGGQGKSSLLDRIRYK